MARKEIKKQFGFLALKGKSMRTFRVLAHTYSAARLIAKEKYPDWKLSRIK